MVLPQTTLSEALDLAGQLRRVMERMEPVGDCRLTMSYGVVQWQDGEGQQDLLGRADKALYRAKRLGEKTPLPNEMKACGRL
jgi:FOG: GGDEF domain